MATSRSCPRGLSRKRQATFMPTPRRNQGVWNLAVTVLGELASGGSGVARFGQQPAVLTIFAEEAAARLPTDDRFWKGAAGPRRKEEFDFRLSKVVGVEQIHVGGDRGAIQPADSKTFFCDRLRRAVHHRLHDPLGLRGLDPCGVVAHVNDESAQRG